MLVAAGQELFLKITHLEKKNSLFNRKSRLVTFNEGFGVTNCF